MIHEHVSDSNELASTLTFAHDHIFLRADAFLEIHQRLVKMWGLD